MPDAKILPSILASDLAQLAKEGERMISMGADGLHLDVMDGHFVPNITIGAPVVTHTRRHLPSAFLDCHLMVTDPLKWVKDFKDAGCNMYTIHVESNDVRETIDQIRQAGMKVGLAVRPGTMLDQNVFSLIEHITPHYMSSTVDMVLIMTVEPGFGGQSFMPSMMEKVKLLRLKYPQLDIQVDGGLSLSTISQAADAGANVIVAGTSIFKADQPDEVIRKMRETVNTTAQRLALRIP